MSPSPARNGAPGRSGPPTSRVSTVDDARDPRRCNGTSKQTGKPCQLFPVPGATVCRFHGGGAPQVRAAARRRLAQQEAAASLAEVGVYPVTNPVEAFADLVSEVVALKDHFADRVAQLESLRYTSTWNTEQMRTEVALYERALDRSGRLLAQWVSLGLETRRVEMSQQVADQVSALISALLVDFGIDPREPNVRGTVRRHLNAIIETGRPADPIPVEARPTVPEEAPADEPTEHPAMSEPAPAPDAPPTTEDDDMAWARFPGEGE